ncbi:MAG: hypothetical protein KDJ65_04995 [Anaerolineae bacterium]|nr:hypothetical protein [Anaerolineae bacterium]
MNSKMLAVIIVGAVVVALAVVLIVPVAMAYGPEDGSGFGLNQIVAQTGLGMGRGNRAGMQEGAMMRGQGQGQGMMQNGGMMRGQGQGQGMMQEGTMMRGQGQRQGMMQSGAMMRGQGQGRGMGNNGDGLGLGAPEASMLTVVAEQLGMEQADLMAELQSGKTMAEVIEAHGVALDTVVDAFLAPRVEQLAEKVANEEITQAQADSYLAMMRAKVTQQLQSEWTAGHGNGSGHGHGNGNASCDHSGQGQGPNFIDEDGDGVCDHSTDGTGQQMGRQSGSRWQ